MLGNKMWKPTLFDIKKGWVSKLVLFFILAKIVVCRSKLLARFVYGSCSRCLFLWVYRYNKPKVFDQSDREYYRSYFTKPNKYGIEINKSNNLIN